MSSDDSTPQGPPEDVKRKFREALDRKNNQQKGPIDGDDHLRDNSPVDHAQGRADHQRDFRRKTG
ncbi:DUF5302 domain-containing protein [Paramicrobacterium agarici]|uniref:DUF5302 domain-containing protein n=1 Tax=Paramicrobacterium agarici TaxID=630514 RepID=A0A2A9DYF1_9MICO|nr:DUF5302 domain-containing protein [Microbacterium agarici]PFG31012.1 hypothetical protein ATJ78_1957 [Microbacterium agarici]TQO24076.1 hypothetical protein FB385_2946 [Microbacterium agarici]